MKKINKRILALLLCVLMICAGPVAVFAETGELGDTSVVEEKIEITSETVEETVGESTEETLPQNEAVTVCEQCGVENGHADDCETLTVPDESKSTLDTENKVNETDSNTVTDEDDHIGRTGVLPKGTVVYTSTGTLAFPWSTLDDYEISIVDYFVVDGVEWYKYSCSSPLDALKNYPYVKAVDVTLNEETEAEVDALGIPMCDCNSGGQLVNHSGDCARVKYLRYTYIVENTADEIYADWVAMDEETKNAILSYLSWDAQDKHAELEQLISGEIEVGDFNTISNRLLNMETQIDNLEASECRDFYDGMMDVYAKAFDNHVLQITVDQLQALDQQFDDMETKLETKHGFTDCYYYEAIYYDENGNPIYMDGTSAISTFSWGRNGDTSLTTEAELEMKKLVSADEENNLTLTLEAFVSGEEFDIKVPSDIILVIDQSASMYIPMGAPGYLDNTTRYSSTELQVLKGNDVFDANGKPTNESYAQLGYLIAQSQTPKTDENGNQVKDNKGNLIYDWFVVQFNVSTGEWDFYCVPNTSTPSQDHDSWGGTEDTPDLHSIPGNEIGKYEFYFYKTQYGALYDALVSFVGGLKDSGVNHRLAVVGFSGGYVNRKYGNGSGVYIGSSFYEFSPENQPENVTGYDSLYASCAISDDIFGSTLLSVQNEYDQIRSTISTVKTDYYNTEHNIGLYMANKIFENSPNEVEGDLVERARSVILFTDGQPSLSISGKAVDVENETISQAALLKGVDNPETEEIEAGHDAKVYTVCTATIGNDDTAYQFLKTASSSEEDFQKITTGEELLKFFEAVVNDVGEVTSALNADAVLTDIISADFVLPKEFTKNWDTMTDEERKLLFTQIVRVYTSDCTGVESVGGPFTWGERTLFEDAEIMISKTEDGLYKVEVSNFDYADNFVSENGRDHNGYDSQAFHGKKLIVEIPIEIAADNLGGTKQATNSEAVSGIYQNGSLVEIFNLPSVDVPTTVTLEKLVTGDNADKEQHFDFKIGYQQFDKYENDDAESGNYLKAVGKYADKSLELKHAKTENIEKVVVGTTLTFSEVELEDYEITKVEVTDAEGKPVEYEYSEDTGVYTVTVVAGMKITVTNKVLTADLTITKEGIDDIDHDTTGDIEEQQSVMFDITNSKGDYVMTVAICGNGSVTIQDLPLDVYTVTEKTDWTWRYKASSDKNNPADLSKGNQTVTFTNEREEIYWLAGDSYAENIFGAVTGNTSEGESN